jgi:hypothetical protein
MDQTDLEPDLSNVLMRLPLPSLSSVPFILPDKKFDHLNKCSLYHSFGSSEGTVGCFLCRTSLSSGKTEAIALPSRYGVVSSPVADD